MNNNNRNTNRDERLAEIIRETAAKYLEEESNRVSLITVTGVQLLNEGKIANVLFTVLPDYKQAEVEDFLRRKRSDFRHYFMSKVKMGRVPTFDFKLDLGEKHRQKIDDLMQNI